MPRSTEPSTASQIITEERDAVPLIGERSGEIGSDRIARALARERGGVTNLTEADQELLDRQRKAERRRAIASAPWRKASLVQLLRARYELPKSVVHKAARWRELSELLPPNLSEVQIAELDDEIWCTEEDMMAAGPEAIAVILRRLAACVMIPNRAPE